MEKRLRMYAAAACVLLSAFFSLAQAQPDQRCATMYMDSILRAQHPEKETDEQFESWLASEIAAKSGGKIINGVYQIPVVVHVIHSGEAVGSGTNVSQAAIQSQIDVLNEDFRKMYGTNGWNDDPVGADVQIEFCLAQRRPDGSAFTAGAPGVNRILYSTISTTAPPFSTTFIESTIKTWTYNSGTPTSTRGWDPSKYLNLWLCDISGGILGYAQFPQSPLGGMGCGSATVATDGVVFLYNSIGKSSVTGFTGVYNEGRTVTHEIGHWLGLRHIWGDGNCSATDYCNDTPTAAASNFGCPAGVNTCTSTPDQPDMVQNYMDYTDDLCMNIFTQDQKMRMRTVLESTPMRMSLITSDACVPPNSSDASITDIFAPGGDNCGGAITPSVQLRNRGSSALTSATIKYTVDNGTPVSYSWTGSLAAGASATVSLPAFTTTYGTHTFKTYDELPNGATDPSTTYDTSSIQFVVSTGIMPNYTENFDGETFPPDLRWTIVNSNSDCYRWTAASGTSAAGTFSNNIAEMPCYGNSSTTTEYLYTPILTLPCGATSPTFNFNVAYRKKASGSTDALTLEMSQDCGATYTSVWTASGTSLAQNTTVLTSEYFPSASTDWKAVSVSLASYVGTTSKNLRFRFKGVSANGNNIFVDDISYSATLGAEITVLQNGIEILDEGAFDFGQVATGSTLTKTFTVKNTGSSALTITPPATITGSGFTVNASFVSTSLAAGASTTFALSFTPPSTGSFTGNFSFTNSDCDEGTYNFALTATGVATPPNASFYATPVVACVGSPVAFTNTTTNGITYSWTFGSSAVPTTSTQANPIVTYTAAGTYPVTLVATNANGSDTETMTGYITVSTGAGTAIPFNEGFTSTTFPPTGWSIYNPDGSTTWARSTAAGNSPTTGNSMLFNNYSVDDTGNSDEVRIKPLSFANYTAVSLTFDVAYAPRNASQYSDALEVLISNDCGVTWTSMYYKGNSTLATASATTSQFTPTTSQWRTETISLTPYAGDQSVIISFRNIAGYGNRLFIDNINVTGTAATAAPVAGFTANQTSVCAGSSVSFTNTSTNSPTSYSWTFAGGTPSTSTVENPVVTYATAGTYTVTLTATNGTGSNTSTQTSYVTVNAIPSAPTISASGSTTFCTGGSVTLTASPSTGVTWSTGQTTAAITVSTAGTYSATTTTNGCTSASSAPVTVTVNSTTTTPTFTNPGPVCSGTSFTLPTTSDNSITGTWSPAVNNTATTTYTFTPTAGQCASTTTMTVTVNAAPATPTITAGGATTFCTGGSVTLTSSASSGNTWSTGATTQSITVSSAGTYTVTATSGGCSATSAGTTVTVNPAPATPTITAGGATTFCSGGSVTLTSSASSGNTWSTGATTQSITVSSAGTYTVTATSGGCSATSAGTTITVNPAPATPTITAGGATTFCSGGSVTLTSSASSGNTWSTGATTQSITVSSAGTYTVTATSGGCSATSAGTTVTVNPAPATPTITAGGATTFCSGGSVTLTSSASSGNTWSTGATTQSITVSSAGTYTVTATSGGCSATSAGTTVTVSSGSTPATFAAVGPYCSGDAFTLPVTSSEGFTGTWSPAVNNTATTTYTFTVNSGQCASNGSLTVTINNPTTATFAAQGPYCPGASFTLPATSNEGFTGTWSPALDNMNTTTYTFTVDAGQCAQNGTSTVTISSLATPTVTASGPTTFCSGGSVTLTSSASSGNTWSNGANSPSITVTNPGTYTVTVTSGGCTSSASNAVTVTVNPSPTVSIGAIPSMCVYNDPVTLTQGSPSGGTYSGNGVTSGTFDPSVAGLGTSTITYTVTGSNGCSSSATSTVQVDACLGLDESTASVLSVYPNPTSGMLTIDAGKNKLTEITVYDALGKLLLVVKPDATSMQLNLSGYALGVYNLKIATESGLQHVPVSVNY